MPPRRATSNFSLLTMRNVRALEYGANRHGKGLAAPLALVDAGTGRFAGQHGSSLKGAAVRADSVCLGQIPWPRLVAIRNAHQRADRADLDAIAALVARLVI